MQCNHRISRYYDMVKFDFYKQEKDDRFEEMLRRLETWTAMYKTTIVPRQVEQHDLHYAARPSGILTAWHLDLIVTAWKLESEVKRLLCRG